MPSLELVVVVLYPGPVLYLLNVHRVLFLSGFPGPTRLLIPKLPIVHQATDRRPSIGSDFDKIQSCFGSPLSSLVKGDDPDLLPLSINESDRADPNLVVDTDPLILDSSSLQSAPTRVGPEVIKKARTQPGRSDLKA